MVSLGPRFAISLVGFQVVFRRGGCDCPADGTENTGAHSLTSRPKKFPHVPEGWPHVQVFGRLRSGGITFPQANEAIGTAAMAISGNARKQLPVTAKPVRSFVSSSRDPEDQKTNPYLKECNGRCPNQCSEHDSEEPSPLDLHAHLLRLGHQQRKHRIKCAVPGYGRGVADAGIAACLKPLSTAAAESIRPYRCPTPSECHPFKMMWLTSSHPRNPFTS
jgi:hypothetical protein